MKAKSKGRPARKVERLCVEPESLRDPAMGDKTPQWAAWLKRTDPAAFRKRFAGRTVNLED